jgi:hypothetical protein
MLELRLSMSLYIDLDGALGRIFPQCGFMKALEAVPLKRLMSSTYSNKTSLMGFEPIRLR